MYNTIRFHVLELPSRAHTYDLQQHPRSNTRVMSSIVSIFVIFVAPAYVIISHANFNTLTMDALTEQLKRTTIGQHNPHKRLVEQYKGCSLFEVVAL